MWMGNWIKGLVLDLCMYDNQISTNDKKNLKYSENCMPYFTITWNKQYCTDSTTVLLDQL